MVKLTEAQRDMLTRLPRGYECTNKDALALVEQKLASWEHPNCTGFLYIDQLRITHSGRTTLAQAANDGGGEP